LSQPTNEEIKTSGGTEKEYDTSDGFLKVSIPISWLIYKDVELGHPQFQF